MHQSGREAVSLAKPPPTIVQVGMLCNLQQCANAGQALWRQAGKQDIRYGVAWSCGRKPRKPQAAAARDSRLGILGLQTSNGVLGSFAGQANHQKPIFPLTAFSSGCSGGHNTPGCAGRKRPCQTGGCRTRASPSSPAPHQSCKAHMHSSI